MTDHPLSEAARLCGVSPRVLSAMLWSGALERDRCRRVGNQTFIPDDYLRWVVHPLLRRRGYNPTALPPVEANR